MIVGGGQAAVTAAAELRRMRYPGDVIMVSDEPHLPYDRTTLSKKFLLGQVCGSQILYRSPESYDKLGVTVLVDSPVIKIERDQKFVLLQDGRRIFYENLVLATGCKARPLVLAQSDTSGVITLRSLADAERLRPRLEAGMRLLVLGGGFLGLEIASSTVALGVSVSLIEAQTRLLGRSASSPFSEAVERLHNKNGTSIQCGEVVSSISSQESGGAVTTQNTQYKADVILAAIGSLPNDELAVDAGLPCRNGILTDSDCRTEDASIFAVGDCASRYDVRRGGHHRSEAIYSAVSQATRAAAIIAGVPAPPERAAYFWSEQFGARLQIAGSVQPEEDVEDVAIGSASAYTVCRFQSGKLACVETINDPKRFVVGRNVLGRARRDALESLEI